MLEKAKIPNNIEVVPAKVVEMVDKIPRTISNLANFPEWATDYERLMNYNPKQRGTKRPS